MYGVFSPLAGGQFATYYRADGYPISLGDGQNYIRPKTGIDSFPTPTINFVSHGRLGWVQGLLPLFDSSVLANMLGRQPFGPYIGEGPQNPVDFFPDFKGGGLRKVGG